MASKFGSVRLDRQTGTWSARYMHNGKRYQRRFKDQLSANAWLKGEKSLIDAAEAGIQEWTPPSARKAQPAEDEQPEPVITLKDYAAQKYDNYRKVDGSEPAVSYVRQLHVYLKHLSTAEFWDKPLDEITAADIATWRNYTRIEQTPLKRAMQQLKRMMKQAEEEGLIDKAPVIGRMPKLPDGKKIPPATPDELKIIYENMPAYDRIGVYLGAVFALRPGETLALQVKDVDIEHRILHIRHSLGRGEGDHGYVRLKATKTASSTDDKPIPDGMIPMLKAQMKGKKPNSPLIVSPRTGSFLTDKAYDAQFAKARVKANRPDLHAHTLRKTAITAAVASGATIAETMKFGRHTDVDVSIQHYQDAGSWTRQQKLTEDVAATFLPCKRTADDIREELDKAKATVAQLENELQRALTEQSGD